MPKLTLPTLPRGRMFIGDTMTIEWQDFFHRLLLRVGGYDAPSISDVSGFGANFNRTIVSGEIAVEDEYLWSSYNVDTEGEAASDDLDLISGGVGGNVIILQAANNARTVVCKNDGVHLVLTFENSLDNTKDKLMLICMSPGIWHELSRASSGS